MRTPSLSETFSQSRAKATGTTRNPPATRRREARLASLSHRRRVSGSRQDGSARSMNLSGNGGRTGRFFSKSVVSTRQRMVRSSENVPSCRASPTGPGAAPPEARRFVQQCVVFSCIIAGSARVDRRTLHMGRVRRSAVALSRITSRHSLGAPRRADAAEGAVPSPAVRFPSRPRDAPAAAAVVLGRRRGGLPTPSCTFAST